MVRLMAMRKLLCIFSASGCLATLASAATPMDSKIEEGKTTLIECEYTKDEPVLVKRFNIAIQKGTYHYNVYVPKGYNTNTDVRYPCLIIQAPGGNANMTNVKDYAQANGWLVLMLVEARNGPIDPSVGNFLAAHDDAVQRFRIMEGRKVATGLSGGARCSSRHVGMRDGFAGVILQGAGFAQYVQGQERGHYRLMSVVEHKDILVYGLFGDKDGNRSEIERLDKELPAYTIRKFQIFAGGHVLAPAENMKMALDWIDAHCLAGKNPALTKAIIMHKVKTGPLGGTQPEQYQKCVAYLGMIGKYRLTNDADMKDVTAKLLEQKSALEKDVSLKKEITAIMEYDKADAVEKKYREDTSKRKMTPSSMKSGIQGCIDTYQRVVATYPDTEAGKKADDRISTLKEELSSLVSSSKKK